MSYVARHRLVDREGRVRRAARIASVLEDFGDVALPGSRLLDVGASHGLITLALAPRVGFAVGVDVDREGVAAAARDREAGVGCAFAIASGMQLPFADGSFDVVVCNHVYEHVPDAPRLMAEVARVLRTGGVCYFAGGHRLQLIEPHHRLPFLSWLPRSAADAWLRALGRGSRYEERFLMPWRLGGLFTAFSSSLNVTPGVLRACARHGLGPPWLESVFRWTLPRPMARIVASLLPTQLWLLRK
ncbi:MAG: class I SAM-dependent methyltransferase [Gammaproteobacteria bacterium]|nr:class I SAM-dependent methyltransferase [Gammaproteobacteria bacterium]